MFLVFKTDANHSYASRDLIGLATSLDSGIDICQQQAKAEGETICDEQLKLLVNIKQTQGYSGEGEFHMEQCEVDTLLT